MKGDFISMSTKEIERLKIIERIYNGGLSQVKAAKILELTDRQVRRLQREYEKIGAAALVSKQRGKTSNRKYSEPFKKQVIECIREQYWDFGPTLATEKLKERQNIIIGIETARLWMTEAGIWKPKIAKEITIHPPRARRACFGELIQIDGSQHAWFEDRGPFCTLIVFIDDATSRIQFMRFFPAETTFAYFKMVELYIEKYGKPMAFYSDKLSVFKINATEAYLGTGETQFGRAMRELGIDLLYANSAPAKGRVERANETLQDRLVKELRLHNISTIEGGNKFLEGNYTEIFNTKFSIPPFDPTDAHREVDEKCNLDIIFTLQVNRKITKNITVRYKSKIYQIIVPGKGYRLRQGIVTVCESESGEITLLHKGQSLNYRVYNKNQYYSEAVSAKEVHLPIRLVHHHKPGPDHPWNKEAARRDKLRELRKQAIKGRKEKIVTLPMIPSPANNFNKDSMP